MIIERRLVMHFSLFSMIMSKKLSRGLKAINIEFPLLRGMLVYIVDVAQPPLLHG